MIYVYDVGKHSLNCRVKNNQAFQILYIYGTFFHAVVYLVYTYTYRYIYTQIYINSCAWTLKTLGEKTKE